MFGATMPSPRDFNPRSPHGERHTTAPALPLLLPFQSTLPARGATPLLRQARRARRFQSTLPARGATRADSYIICTIKFQSTLPARGATVNNKHPNTTRRFQSTLPARGATINGRAVECVARDFNPRSPHGERLTECPAVCDVGISIHAPRTGSDIRMTYSCDYSYSISIHAPRTGSDITQQIISLLHGISIHAPRTGSDPIVD